MKKKITYANEAARERLRAIKMVQDDWTKADVAKEFGVHYTTIAEWCKMYEEGGVERLNAPRKTVEKVQINEKEIQELLKNKLPKKDQKKLGMLLTLAKLGSLSEAAKIEGVSPQYLARIRKKFTEGEIPSVVII